MHFTHCAAAHWNWEKIEIVIRSQQLKPLICDHAQFLVFVNCRLQLHVCHDLASQQMLLVFFFYLIGRGGPDKRTVWLLAKFAMFVGMVARYCHGRGGPNKRTVWLVAKFAMFLAWWGWLGSCNARPSIPSSHLQVCLLCAPFAVSIQRAVSVLLLCSESMCSGIQRLCTSPIARQRTGIGKR